MIISLKKKHAHALLVYSNDRPYPWVAVILTIKPGNMYNYNKSLVQCNITVEQVMRYQPF